MIDFTKKEIQEWNKIVSEKMRSSKIHAQDSFRPTPETFRELHRQLFSESELSFAAGVYRTLPLKWGKTIFAPAHQVPALMDEVFSVERVSVWAILAWTHDVVEYIHPFLDGNRRTTWIFTNMWLTSLGYIPIDWIKLRPNWELGIQTCPTLEERLINTLKELSI